MEQLERIGKLEEKLDRAIAALRARESAVEAYQAAAGDIRDLDAYLSGKEWRADLDADEKGLLPEGMKRGVLSEDGIYNMLEDERELLKRMRELAERYEERYEERNEEDRDEDAI